MKKGIIPEIINNFNLYKGVDNGGEKFLGVTGEITMPDLEGMTETITGSGILGEVEVTNPGHYSAINMEIPFVALCDDMLQLHPSKMNMLTMRMSEQSTIKGSGEKCYTGLKVVVGGTVKAYKLGTVKIGGQMGSSVTLSVNYIKISVDNDVLLELDKINGRFVLDNEDITAEINKLC